MFVKFKHLKKIPYLANLTLKKMLFSIYISNKTSIKNFYHLSSK